MANKYRSWVDGEVLTAANVIDYLQKGAVIVCDSSTDYPTADAREGMFIYDVALDAMLCYTGSTWVRTAAVTTTAVQTYTPTLMQGASSVAFGTANEARYIRTGCVVEAWVSVTATASGPGNQKITVSLPVTSSGHYIGGVVGHAAFRDASTSTWYALEATLDTTSAVNFVNTPGTSTFGADAAVTIASGDVLRMHVRYTV
jgi:hypothetical protein